MQKQILDADIGKGWSAFEGGEVDELVHSAGVVVDIGETRFVYCSGRTATPDDAEDVARRNEVIGAGDIYEQTTQVCRNLERTLGMAGATIDDIVRVRVYVTQPMTRRDFQRIHEARAKFFKKEHYPASTLVIVHALAREGALIEIDADAVLPTETALERLGRA